MPQKFRKSFLANLQKVISINVNQRNIMNNSRDIDRVDIFINLNRF